MHKSRTPRFILIPILLVFLGCCLLSQLQPILLHAMGAVAGSFGVQPQSHRCIGFSIPGNDIQSFFPAGNIHGGISAFEYRYFVAYNTGNYLRRVCIGQDLWYGD